MGRLRKLRWGAPPLLLGLMLWLGRARPPIEAWSVDLPRPRMAADGAFAEAVPATAPTANAPGDAMPPLAGNTFVGTAADGAVHYDPQTLQLHADVALRRLFDYVLLAEGAASPSALQAMLQHMLRARAVPPGVERQILTLWRHYRALRSDAANLAEGAVQPVVALQALMRQHLGEAAAVGLFADQQALLRQAHGLFAAAGEAESTARGLAFAQLVEHGPYAAGSHAQGSLAAAQLREAGRAYLVEHDAEGWERALRVHGVDAARAGRILAALAPFVLGGGG